MKHFSIFDRLNKALKHDEHDVVVSTKNDCTNATMEKEKIEGLIRNEDARETSDTVEPNLSMLVPKEENTEERLEVLVEEARRLHHFPQDQVSSIGERMVGLLTEQINQKIQEIPGMCRSNISSV